MFRRKVNFLLLVWFIILNNDVVGDNVTGKYYRTMPKSVFKTRQRKLIGFDTDGLIRLDLDFNVPFITVPIKKSMDMAKTSLLNMNIASLVLTGAIIFGAAVALPVILAIFNKKGLIPSNNPMSALYKMGSQRSEESNAWRFVTILDNSLSDNNIDLKSCSQRVMCWAVKNSAQNVARGRGSSADKILDGMASSKWIQEYVLNSLLSEAVKLGLKGENCSSVYEKCKLNYDTTHYFLTYYLDKFNRG